MVSQGAIKARVDETHLQRCIPYEFVNLLGRNRLQIFYTFARPEKQTCTSSWKTVFTKEIYELDNKKFDYLVFAGRDYIIILIFSVSKLQWTQFDFKIQMILYST